MRSAASTAGLRRSGSRVDQNCRGRAGDSGVHRPADLADVGGIRLPSPKLTDEEGVVSGGINRQIRLAARPSGLPGGGTWRLTEENVPKPSDGAVLVAVDHVSITPAMRTWLRDTDSYVPPVQVGDVMRAQGTGKVVESRDPRHAVGDSVVGWFGVQTHATARGDAVTTIDTKVAPASTWLGLLGNTGLTAYFGLFFVAAAKPGETVLVSGAAGAVGSTVAQLAKQQGCYVVGIAGGPQKCAWLLDELGLDGAVDYKAEGFAAALKAAASKGFDVFFDNVGGTVLDAGLARIGARARIVICGGISSYNSTDLPPGPANYMSLVVKSASMTGFLLADFADHFDLARRHLAAALTDGTLTAREHLIHGDIAMFPEALGMLFAGANTGKLVLSVA